MTSSIADWEIRPTPDALRRRYLDSGSWTDDTLGAWCDARLAEHADLEFRVWSRARPCAMTLGAIRERARRFAAGLRARGIGAGDSVAIQLPNQAEAAVAIFGASFAGVVLVPLVGFYGPKELRFVLPECRARAFVTSPQGAGGDFASVAEDLRVACPELEWTAVVGDAPLACVPFEALMAEPPLGEVAIVDPDAPALVGFTSGTTADPKGVIHTHRTFLAGVREPGNGMPDARPYLAGSPISHVMGLIGSFLYALHVGKPIHLVDGWEPSLVFDAMREGDAVFNWGPPFFVTSLLEAPGFSPAVLDHLRFAGLGGAPVAPTLANRLEDLGIRIVRAYGSTEQLTATMSLPDAPREKRLGTDGRPGRDTELRLVDDAGREVPIGTPGEIRIRSPRNFVGYTDPALTRVVLDADGWYATGDIAVADADGFVTIVDRKQDIIIRGGENISAAEVEDVLLGMPGVLEVAVVAAPDPRMGEHGCAFLRSDASAAAPTLGDLRAHLAAVGLGKKK
ncbi:MAG: AMP-binding protein, partial [Myxococcales bacterium]|nr:AMP-binding protein [Myxococcales bacterium]